MWRNISSINPPVIHASRYILPEAEVHSKSWYPKVYWGVDQLDGWEGLYHFFRLRPTHNPPGNDVGCLWKNCHDAMEWHQVGDEKCPRYVSLSLSLSNTHTHTHTLSLSLSVCVCVCVFVCVCMRACVRVHACVFVSLREYFHFASSWLHTTLQTSRQGFQFQC